MVSVASSELIRMVRMSRPRAPRVRLPLSQRCGAKALTLNERVFLAVGLDDHDRRHASSPSAAELVDLTSAPHAVPPLELVREWVVECQCEPACAIDVVVCAVQAELMLVVFLRIVAGLVR